MAVLCLGQVWVWLWELVGGCYGNAICCDCSSLGKEEEEGWKFIVKPLLQGEGRVLAEECFEGLVLSGLTDASL